VIGTWRPRRRGQRGSSVLYVIVLSPVLLLGVALATEAGALQMQKQRLQSAVDVSAVVAAASAARAGGRARIDVARAEGVSREVLAGNLAPLAGVLSGTGPLAVARDADVAVITDVPAPDPFVSGAVVTRPTLELRVRIPVRTGLFAAAGLPPVVTLTLVASAGLREAAST